MDSSLSPEHFPSRLEQLGFQGRVIRGVEVIVPPVCTVPAGPFLMGSDPKRDRVVAKQGWTDRVLKLLTGVDISFLRSAREQPQHTVTLPAYEIARFSVTVAEYACFVRAGQPEPKSNRNNIHGVFVDWQTQLQRLDHPVVGVSWHDAVAYTAWLSERTGERWRLPTEAEWEKAARGTNGQIYPWGNQWDSTRANTDDGGSGSTTPVGSYPSGTSPYGALDMVGNVLEWTGSRCLPYPYTVTGEREDPKPPGDRVLRGGSFGWSARAATRSSAEEDRVRDFFGFRLVQAVPNP
jgi:formylglycine-generating enzyme required for sulfatase activity